MVGVVSLNVLDSFSCAKPIEFDTTIMNSIEIFKNDEGWYKVFIMNWLVFIKVVIFFV